MSYPEAKDHTGVAPKHKEAAERAKAGEANNTPTKKPIAPQKEKRIMDELESLMIKKIQLLNKINSIDAKTQEAHDKKAAPYKQRLAKLDAEIKKHMEHQRGVLESIQSINSRIDNIRQYSGDDSAAYRIKDWAVETTGIKNKQVAKYVLTNIKAELERIINFNRMYGVKGDYDNNKLQQVNDKLAQLGD